MARNRTRRSDEHAPRPAPADSARIATARSERTNGEPLSPDEEAPAPLEHAAPDAELAEAQLARTSAEAQEPDPSYNEAELEDDFVDEEPPLDDGDVAGGGGPGGPRRRRGGGGGDDSGGGEVGGGHLPAASPASAPRRRNALVAFVQGSWRELHRVQWPDRRQVTQATGVVIGFVIVAGAYLALADWVAGKVVHFILS